MMTMNNGNGREAGIGDSSFEQSFGNLQEVVRKLSEGNLTLQEALAAFEQGMMLADRCASMLEQAELRVKQVSEGAMRAGNAAARELAQPVAPLDMGLGLGAELDEPELVAFDAETYESTIVIGTVGDMGSGRSSGGARASGQPTSGARGSDVVGRDKPSAAKTPPRILDPLFDEDD